MQEKSPKVSAQRIHAPNHDMHSAPLLQREAASIWDEWVWLDSGLAQNRQTYDELRCPKKLRALVYATCVGVSAQVRHYAPLGQNTVET